MNFDIDDPLAGILSDGSDDSFFDDDILGKKKTIKKTTPIPDKKKSVFNLDETDKSSSKLNERKNSLFDLTSIDDNPIPKQLDTGNSSKTTLKPEPKSSQAPVRQIISKEPSLKRTDSFKSNLNINKKSPAKSKPASKLDLLDDQNVKKEEAKVLERGKSSQSILDDILGTPKKNIPITQLNYNTIKSSQEIDLDDLLGKETKSAPIKSVQKKEKTTPKQEDKSKKKSSSDWLGLFDDKENDNADDNMPSWLAGSDSKKKQTVEKEKKIVLIENEEVAEPKEIKDESINLNMEHIKPITMPMVALAQSSNDDITTEGAALCLQQQESQFMVALQLKAQEDKLAAMQMRQEETQRIQIETTRAHHTQVEAMLERHAAHRQQMQAVIADHQERINERIKALLKPSTIDNESFNTEEDAGVTKREHPHSKEKKQLLQLVQSLQENHDREIELMETSYRRQLAFVEVSLSQSEERMKDEAEKLHKFYTEKIGWLEDHHSSYKRLMEENMQSVIRRHEEEVDMLRLQHVDNVKTLQEHHAALMENVKNAVKQEQTLIQESVGFSTNLNELVGDVRENKAACEVLVDTVRSLVENTKHNAEKTLHIKDVQINEMMDQLKKEREQFETEKTDSRDLVKLLESRLRQMTQFIEDETAALKQRRMELEFEKATFNKQTEFAKNILKKQDEEVKTLREEIEKEYNEKISRIEEDKAKAQKENIAVAKEKASVQNIKQELEKLKAELHIQLEEVTDERSKLNLEKQHLQMEGQRIVAKSRDLELLVKAAVEKQSAADQKYTEAEHIQRKYEERIRKIQEQFVSVNLREKNIAKEKLALSRERLNIHSERKLLESKQKCSLCKSMQSGDSEQKYDDIYLTNTNYNVNNAMSNIENEMAHILSRNFSMKSSEEVVKDVEQSASILEDGRFKEYMDPKLLMLRLDVQKVLSNIEQSKEVVSGDDS